MSLRRRATVPAVCLALALRGAAGWSDPTARELVEADAAHAQFWWSGFIGVYSAFAITRTGLALATSDPDERVDHAVDAATAWLGVGSMVISTIPRVWRARDEAARTGRWDLALARAAEAETAALAWWNHAACVAVALASGAVLWLGYDHPTQAAVSTAMNLLVGEVNLWTAPRRSMRAAARPRAWTITPAGAGLVLRW
ncbi:MAG: hypothetical protein U0325_11155 [Polyangiales bacterium]